ncbi:MULTISPECIES: acetyltransferase [unclassified Psychrobacter]|uniref:acetyltransferase n=1 Tax=unclassified Psychrobacter TaxID=196806 RepID=UPI003F467219
MQQLIGIYGASGNGKQVVSLLKLQYPLLDKFRIVFIDDFSKLNTLMGHQVWRYEQFLSDPSKNKAVIIAISDSRVRELLADKIEQDSIPTLSIHAPTAIILDPESIEVGEGSILSPHTCLTNTLKIGKFFHGNLYCHVSHDSIIGDYVTFAPRVSCSGNVHIHDHVYVGVGAVIKQGTSDKPLVIGKGAVIGMGAVVTKDVPAGAIMVGNPARALVK